MRSCAANPEDFIVSRSSHLQPERTFLDSLPEFFSGPSRLPRCELRVRDELFVRGTPLEPLTRCDTWLRTYGTHIVYLATPCADVFVMCAPALSTPASLCLVSPKMRSSEYRRTECTTSYFVLNPHEVEGQKYQWPNHTRIRFNYE